MQSHPHSPSPSSLWFSKFAALPSGRRSKWIVLALWIVAVAALSPLAGKLGDVEDNDTAAWLPGNAESLKVANLQTRFPAGDTLDAVVVYHRDGGLTADDQAKIAADRAALTSAFPDAPPSDPIPSRDGQATIYVLPIPRPVDDSSVCSSACEAADKIRAITGSGSNGLEIRVTGPAGFYNDFAGAFDGIDGKLLLATILVVACVLLLTYRSPVLWLVPLVSVGLALQVAEAVVYLLADHAGISVNGQSAGILPVLVFGVGTDYALLLIARYREELRRHEDKHEAMAFALRQAGPAILASAATVVIGLLCLLAADLNPTAGLGPVGAVGIIGALLAMMTLLPAVLVIFGRRLFWPFVPAFGSPSHETTGAWSRIGAWVARRPRPVWVGSTLLLALLALGGLGINTTLPQMDQFRTTPDSILGQQLIATSYPAGASAPNTVIANTADADAVSRAIAQTPGVAEVRTAGTSVDGALVAFAVTFDAEPGSQAAFDAVDRLRAHVHPVPGANAIVGGPDAQALDTAVTSARDRKVIMPLILLVVLVILGLLLRAVVAPVMLMVTVIVSFAAALGVTTLVADHIFGFAAIEGSIPLLGFVFLVALGIDYNIFLMSRVHEESVELGARAGMLKGLAVTGGVITSAGAVLAATFAVLSVLPLVAMTELGFLVAFGVLLDTLLVRSVLVPALTFELGDRIWWPSRLAHGPVANRVRVRRSDAAVTTAD